MSDTEETPKRRGLQRPIEVFRQELRDDPETTKMAEALGLTVDEFVEKVIGYAKNPDKEPELVVIDEEEAAEEGIDVPSVADVQRWLKDVENGKVPIGTTPVHVEDGFTTQRPDEEVKKAVGVDADLQAPTVGAPKSQIVVEDTPMGSILRQQLRNQQQKTALGSKLPQPREKPKR
ncbi:MAG: hypothetical protein HYV07_30695 [Deltaproteobacteria bacterium]|nr:hypothetical protein [Deltaproteobacteria bacterium]